MLASFCSGVGFLRFSHPFLVSALFPGPSLLEMKFLRKLFPLVSVLFWEVSEPSFKYNSFHLRIQYHTADKRIYR